MCHLLIQKRLNGYLFDWVANIFKDGKVVFSNWNLRNEESFQSEIEAIKDAKAMLKKLNIKICKQKPT